jgi:hypothetical protein
LRVVIQTGWSASDHDNEYMMIDATIVRAH